MATIAEKVDRYLRAIYDKTDPLYKVLFSNVDGVPEATVDNPMDYNIGIMSDLLEWNRQLSISLVKQLFFDQSEGLYLNLIAADHFGLSRVSGQDDSEYKARTSQILLTRKMSPASIIYIMRPFSSSEPEIIEEQGESAFADLTFSDVYVDSFQNLGSTSNHYETGWWVFPAVSYGNSAYFFLLKLENTADEDILNIIDLLNRWIASGIDYAVQINYV